MSFWVLVFAHLLGDYPLQGDFLATMKGKYRLLMISHCAIWTGCVGIAAHLVGVHVTISTLCFLYTVHILADTFKSSGGYGFTTDPLGWPLYVDQSIHVAQLVAVLLIHW